MDKKKDNLKLVVAYWCHDVAPVLYKDRFAWAYDKVLEYNLDDHPDLDKLINTLACTVIGEKLSASLAAIQCSPRSVIARYD